MSYTRADPIALSFNDTILRVSDIQLLQGPHWLNDQILSFYFEYLETIKYKTNPELLFVSPEVTQCMKLMSDVELKSLIEHLNANKKLFIFFALNDNESHRAGGTHWSLLVFSRPERTFFHFDSLGNSNQDAMQQFVNRIKEAFDCRICHMKPIRCLQQSNSYDCGIHVLCMTDNIADYVNRFECVNGVEPLHHDTISAKRGELLKLISSLGGKV